MQELTFLERIFVLLVIMTPLIGLTALMCWVADMLDKYGRVEPVEKAHYTWKREDGK